MKIVKWSIALGVLNTLFIAGFVYKSQSAEVEAAAYVNVASLYEAFDMTQELVDLISAQRNFQANSRALDVHNQLQQNIAVEQGNVAQLE